MNLDDVGLEARSVGSPADWMGRSFHLALADGTPPQKPLDSLGCGSKKPVPKWVALVSGSMEAKPCGLPL